MALITEYVSVPVWATRRYPLLYCTRAALPTPAIGEPEAVEIVIVLFDTVALMVGSVGALPGLFPLPEHAETIELSTPLNAITAPVCAARTKNSLRVCRLVSITSPFEFVKYSRGVNALAH
jgi:hypothetical protein